MFIRWTWFLHEFADKCIYVYIRYMYMCVVLYTRFTFYESVCIYSHWCSLSFFLSFFFSYEFIYFIWIIQVIYFNTLFFTIFICKCFVCIYRISLLRDFLKKSKRVKTAFVAKMTYSARKSRIKRYKWAYVSDESISAIWWKSDRKFSIRELVIWA